MNPIPRYVKLTPAEVAEGRAFGRVNDDRATARGYANRAKLVGNDNARENAELGACGVIAASKATGIAWNRDHGAFSTGGDLIGGYEVRTTRRLDGTLKVHPKDPDDRIFILVVGDLASPIYAVIGWQWAAYGKNLIFMDDPGGRGFAYFVPQRELHDLNILPRVMAETAP